jgi:translation initiation factor IF-1
MSGAGRKHRAKKLTSDFLDETWEPVLTEHEVPAIVTSTASGGKVVGVAYADGTIKHVTVPGKFHKVIWLLRGDPVIVADDATLARKLSPAQAKALSATDASIAALFAQSSSGADKDSGDVAADAEGAADTAEAAGSDAEDQDEFVNPNRCRYGSRRRLEMQDTDEDEEEEEED